MGHNATGLATHKLNILAGKLIDTWFTGKAYLQSALRVRGIDSASFTAKATTTHSIGKLLR